MCIYFYLFYLLGFSEFNRGLSLVQLLYVGELKCYKIGHPHLVTQVQELLGVQCFSNGLKYAFSVEFLNIELVRT